MASTHPKPPARNADAPFVILEIADRDGETALRLPVVVLNLTAGVVTLESIYPQADLGWDNFHGRHSNLRLRFKGGEEPIDLDGNLVWTKLSGQSSRQLILGLELDRPTLTARKILTDLIPHPGKDIKGLWDRWDQAYPNQRSPQPHQKIYLLGLLLLLGGVALQMGTKSYQLFGWLLWFLGSLAVAGKSLYSFWQKRVSR